MDNQNKENATTENKQNAENTEKTQENQGTEDKDIKNDKLNYDALLLEQKKLLGKIGILTKDFIKLRRDVKGKDTETEKSKPNKEETVENNKEISELKELIKKDQEENKRYRMEIQLTDKMKAQGIDEKHTTLIKKLLKIDMSEKGVDNFAIDEFLRDIIEEYPNLKKISVTPPSGMGGSNKPNIDYKKLTHDQRRNQFKEELGKL